MHVQSITRRRLLAAGGGTAVAGTLVGAAEASAKKGAAKGGGKKLTVQVNVTAFDAVRQPATGDKFPTGPYYASGDIYNNGSINPDGTPKTGAKKIGTYQCHGWFYDGKEGLNLASQTFTLTNRGSITLIGREPELAAIAGGTGSYRNARGQATVKDEDHPSGATTLTVAFEVIG
jgi:hypothetical protein